MSLRLVQLSNDPLGPLSSLPLSTTPSRVTQLELTYYCSPPVPLPDERRPGRASDLIKRFQAAVDQSGEAPLVPSSSFASAGKPRVSVAGAGVATLPLAAVCRSSAAGADTKEAVAEPVEEQNGGVKEQDDEPMYLRSAGLSEKPTAAKEEQGRKNAQEAFVDVQPAQPQAQADALVQNTTLPERRASPVPPVAVTQSSLDVPAPVTVPGSADLLAFPSAEPTEAAEADSGRLSPMSPSTPTKGKEGLSRPTSPSVEAGLLRAPPMRDDDSPPPPPFTDSSPAPRKSLSPPQTRASHAPSLTSSISRTNVRTSSSPGRSAHPTGRLTSPTASSLAKARPRISSTTTSPTRSRPTTSSGATTTASLSAPRRPLTASPPSVSASRTSPQSSRSSLTPSTDPRCSPAMGRQRSGSIGSTTSRGAAMTGSARGPTPAKAMPTSGTPRSGKPAGKTSPTASQESPAKADATTSTPTRTAAKPSSSSTPARGSPTLRRPAGRGRIGLAGARMNRGGNHAVGGRKDKEEGGEQEGEAQPSVQGPETKNESREMTLRGLEQVEESDPSSSAGTDEQPPSSPSESAPAPGPSNAPAAPSDAILSSSGPLDDDIPVFKGFGSRPHGRIPIPMENEVDPETGEERMVAKQPREAVSGGEGAEPDGKEHGGEGEEKSA
ncbi:hypothetical protein JCM1841_002350 [Sporobolomyces salmonicolor]